jgi:hypothetical protein
MYYTAVSLPGFPDALIPDMRNTASRLAQKGFILRTGFDDAAWGSFMGSAKPFNRYVHISTNDITPTDLRIAKDTIREKDKFGWDCMDKQKKMRYARNVALLLGIGNSEPSKFLLCWTPNGAECAAHCTGLNGKTGFVGFFIIIARTHGIPVINLHRPEWEAKLNSVLSKIEKSSSL